MSGLLWVIKVTYMHWLWKYYQTNISSNLSFTYFSNISSNPSFNYVSEAKVVWNHKGFVLGLRWLDWIFLGGYFPSLSINYVGMSKDMEKGYHNCII